MNERKILFMISIKETESKVTSAKKNITIKDALVSELRFVDETGDVTEQVLSAIPENFKTINIKITLELPDEVDLSEDE
jgi:hypothetical protein